MVEVGCGLGAILSRVTAKERFGYDVDGAVIRAARLLRGRSVTFIEGGFESVSQPAIDVLIAVNWIHDFPPEQIERWLSPLLPRCRYILLDAIDRSSPLSYQFYHDFAFLDGQAAVVRTDAFGEAHRRFILYEVGR
ncbi:MAG: class I SAM-dependent methyltransferase [Sphingomicrobium sp.]